MGDIAPWLQEHYDGWERAVSALQSRGWVAEYLGSAAPVQVEGELPSGERFYFRGKYNGVSLAIGGSNPADVPTWRTEESCEDAGYLPGNEGLEIILRLWEKYRTDSEAT